MPTGLLTISEYSPNPPIQISSGSTTEVRGWYNRSFIAGDGVTVIEGNSSNGENGFFYVIGTSINLLGNLVVEAHEIQATTLSNPTANYFEGLWINGSFFCYLMPSSPGASGWQIPTVYGDPIAFDEIATYNRAKRLLYPPNTYFTADMTIQEILRLAGNFDYAAVAVNGITSMDVAPVIASLPIAVGSNSYSSTSHLGIAKISVAPALASNPIAVGTNDPRLTKIFNVQAYGALGDGTTDDRTAIQLADTAAALVNGAVYFPAVAASYLTTGSLRPSSNTMWFGDGYGSQIKCPTAGWTLSSPTNFGIINIDSKSNVRVTGLRITGTNSVTTGTTAPKLIFLYGNSGVVCNNIQIDHCNFDTSVDEGIWEGGFQIYITQISVTDNYFTNISYKGSVYGGLPSIQLNVEQAVIANNRFYQVGNAIGCSGFKMVVVGNYIEDPSSLGIATGDGQENGTVTIAGNTILINEEASGGQSRRGIAIDGGSGSDHLIDVSGNTVRLVGTAARGTGTCYSVTTGTQVQFTGNTAEIQIRGAGFNVRGSAGGTNVSFKSNVVRVLAENGLSYGIRGRALVGETLTVRSATNNVYGTTVAQGSNAYSFTSSGGGVLTASMAGDVKTDGSVEIGSAIYGTPTAGGADATNNVPLFLTADLTGQDSFTCHSEVGMLTFGTYRDFTISGGTIDISGVASVFVNRRTRIRVDTESAAGSDDLDTITGGQDGDVLIMESVVSTRDVVVKNGTGNIFCGTDFTLATVRDRIILIYDAGASKWYKLSSATN